MTNAIHGGQMVLVDGPPLAAPEVTSPQALVHTPQPTIGGTATPESVVTVRLDGSVAGTTRADAQGQWNFTPPTALAEGRHRIVAIATDAVGNISPDSEERNFTFLPVPRSHYGWNCTTAPALPATWALLTLALALRRRRLRSP
jgi:hypothetical protein